MSSNQNKNKKRSYKAVFDPELFDSLKKEFDRYEEYGIKLKFNGKPSNSYKLAKTCSYVCESSVSYMRDYVSKDNIVTELDIYTVPE